MLSDIESVITGMYTEDEEGNQNAVVDWRFDKSAFEEVLSLSLSDGQKLKIVVERTIVDTRKRSY